MARPCRLLGLFIGSARSDRIPLRAPHLYRPLLLLPRAGSGSTYRIQLHACRRDRLRGRCLRPPDASAAIASHSSERSSSSPTSAICSGAASRRLSRSSVPSGASAIGAGGGAASGSRRRQGNLEFNGRGLAAQRRLPAGTGSGAISNGAGSTGGAAQMPAADIRRRLFLREERLSAPSANPSPLVPRPSNISAAIPQSGRR